ncbi:MAG: PEP-CTERM sorting domain-containing protein [Pseudomonadota bacterium]
MIDSPDSLDPGPGFSIDYSAFNAQITGGALISNTLDFDFRITVLDPTLAIRSVLLDVGATDPTCTATGINGCTIADALRFLGGLSDQAVFSFRSNATSNNPADRPRDNFDPVRLGDFQIRHVNACGQQLSPTDVCDFFPQPVTYNFAQTQVEVTEVPEPAAWALFLIGLTGLGVGARQAKRRRL